MTANTSNPLGHPFIAIQPHLKESSHLTPSKITDISTNYISEELFDYVILPITNQTYHEKCLESVRDDHSVPEITIGDVLIRPDHKVTPRTIGLISTWLQLDSTDELSLRFARDIALKEVEYAKYVGVKEIILPGPQKGTENLGVYSMIVLGILKATESQNVSVSLSLPWSSITAAVVDDDEEEGYVNCWEVWNSVREFCSYNNRLKVCLAIVKLTNETDHVRDQWLAEPVSMLILNNEVWLENSNHFNVLGKSEQIALHKFHVKKPLLIIPLSSPSSSGVAHIHKQRYLTHILTDRHPPLSIIDQLSFSHYDTLLPPLQPLSTNLDNYTYEVFGQDPVKYQKYGEAITLALGDLKEKCVTEVRIAMVGAGKGLIVDQILKGIKITGVSTSQLTILEKNPVALIDLRMKYSGLENTEVVDGDMRHWKPRNKYHLIVSELLGSFGCNELSPECLKPLESHLDAHHGVMIPQHYESLISLASYPKLYQMLKNHDVHSLAFDKHYVVRPKDYYLISTPRHLWSFHHPSTTPNLERSASVTLSIPHQTSVHAIMGYFIAKLYHNVEINNMYDTGLETPDMTSWFPMVFPLSQPLSVMGDGVVNVTLIRRCERSRVWYEWCLESYVHAKGRRMVRVGGTRVHNFDGMGFSVDGR